MPRVTAALTMEPVLGPRRTSSSSSRSRPSARRMSKGSSSIAAWHSAAARSSASRPTGSSVYCTTTWNTPGSGVAIVWPNATGQPAAACRPSATASSAWAIEIGSLCPNGRKGLTSGNRARSRVTNSGTWSRSLSRTEQAAMDSMAVWRLHKLGPRRARMRDTSILIPVCRCDGCQDGAIGVPCRLGGGGCDFVQAEAQ